MADVRVGKEVQFSCEEHQESFLLLTKRQQEYVAAYMESGSRVMVAKKLGITGSVKGVGKRLSQIAKQMGLDSIRQLKPNVAKPATVTSAQLLAKIKTQRFRCALSGVKLVPETAQLDHIVPLSSDGSNDVDNLQWLDASVNKAKGTMSQDEFIRMCKQVAQWNG
jgi:hypothetical protein